MNGLEPMIVAPDFVTLLVTSTAVYSGTLAAGGALLPPLVLHVPPHTVEPAGMFANPLKEFGATPPLTAFRRYQSSAQNVAVAPTAALPSPITKLPPGVQAKLVTDR
jgi:hypothetical protein